MKTLAECSSFAKYMGHYVFACRKHKDAEMFADKTLEEIILLIEADVDRAVEQAVEQELRAVLNFPEAVRVCEGAGPENLLVSVAVTVGKLRDALPDKRRLDFLENQKEGAPGDCLSTLHLSKCYGSMGRSWFTKNIRKAIDEEILLCSNAAAKIQ